MATTSANGAGTKKILVYSYLHLLFSFRIQIRKYFFCHKKQLPYLGKMEMDIINDLY